MTAVRYLSARMAATCGEASPSWDANYPSRRLVQQRRRGSQRGRSSIDDVPEYLAPGVYVEEVSYRSKSIEGVSTSTNRFVGAIRSGAAVATKWVGFLSVGILLGVAGATTVTWAWRRRRHCRGRCKSSTRTTAAR